ncbi:hypothetical protein GGR06_001622 [Bacteroides reticulotermitis]|uniref:Uncharacterized protein n=1 Tax=Bacteroides reticulotermitis TaxID=1133319 RepID=A0A840CWX7_9BACE|nr:hypothetical protein [Bacteroides reticulotermitis]
MGLFIGFIIGLIIIISTSYYIQKPWFRQDIQIKVSPKWNYHLEYHVYVRKTLFIYRKVAICKSDVELKDSIERMRLVHNKYNLSDIYHGENEED